MNEGHLFVVSGPSGAGKGTVCRRLLEEVDAVLSVSMTTRLPRPGEVEGDHYIFTSAEDFERAIGADELLEHALVYGNYYGTPKRPVTDKLRGGTDVVLEIDTQGAFQVKERCPDAILMFILPPSMAELRNRIEKRGSETEEAISRRLGEALKEIELIERYDYCVVNGVLAEAVAKVKSVIVAEHLKTGRGASEIIKKYKEET